MFSGIIEKVGKVENIEGNILRIKSDEIARSVEISESVSVSGACLTVIDVEKRNGFFTVNVIPETYSRTNFRSLSKGSEVNLETALRVGGKFGGHMVQGHVDCIAEILSIEQNDDSWIVTFDKPEKISRYLVEKGFITIDGVSFTVADTDKNSFSVAVIPYTWDNTIISGYKVGYIINLEADMTAKYVENLLKYQPR